LLLSIAALPWHHHPPQGGNPFLLLSHSVLIPDLCFYRLLFSPGWCSIQCQFVIGQENTLWTISDFNFPPFGEVLLSTVLQLLWWWRGQKAVGPWCSRSASRSPKEKLHNLFI
jgi:hypothetical protein